MIRSKFKIDLQIYKIIINPNLLSISLFSKNAKTGKRDKAQLKLCKMNQVVG